MPPLARALGAATAAVALSTIVVLEPLAVYSIALAAFGLPHVLSELRFVDLRFGWSLRGKRLASIAGVVLLMLSFRIALVCRWAPGDIAATSELLGLAALAALAARGATVQTLVAGAAAAAFVLASVLSPFDALVWVAVLHNLTPLGFLWRAAPPERRSRILGLAAAGLLGLPLLVATGLPRHILAPFAPRGLIDPLAAGPLAKTLFVYVPPSLLGGPHARDVFSAAVLAQCGHYICVIVVLPLLVAKGASKSHGLVRWPRPHVFGALCSVVGLVGLLRFGAGFADARTLYSLLAAVHVWIEAPVLIIALMGANQQADRNAPWRLGRAGSLTGPQHRRRETQDLGPGAGRRA